MHVVQGRIGQGRGAAGRMKGLCMAVAPNKSTQEERAEKRASSRLPPNDSMFKQFRPIGLMASICVRACVRTYVRACVRATYPWRATATTTKAMFEIKTPAITSRSGWPQLLPPPHGMGGSSHSTHRTAAGRPGKKANEGSSIYLV